MNIVLPVVLALLAPLAPPALPAGSTWIVDASGGGDFSSILEAVNAAAPGDVLLVLPGNYGPFLLDKELSILGVPPVKPVVNGTVLVTAPTFRMAGLHLRQLEIRDVTGIALLDDLLVDGLLGPGSGCHHALLVQDSNLVHITRTVVRGKHGDIVCEGPGLVVKDSVVTFTGGEIEGGTGWGDSFIGYDGKPALVAVGSARVTLSGANIRGGNAGTPEILFGGTGGYGAPALNLTGTPLGVKPHVVVRGSALHLVSGGQAGGGQGSEPAYTVASGMQGSTLVFSGAQHWPEDLGTIGLNVVEPAIAESFATLTGGDEAGNTKRLNLHGPAGVGGLLLIGAELDWSTPSSVTGGIFLDPASLLFAVPVVFAGQDSHISLLFQLPASLAGLEGSLLGIQGFAAGLGVGGTWQAQSPVFVLLRGAI